MNKYFNIQKAIEPSLGVHSNRLSYITTTSGDYQIWQTTLDTFGPTNQITYGNTVTFHHYAPSEDFMIYGMDDNGNEKDSYFLISGDGIKNEKILNSDECYRIFGCFTSNSKKFCYSQITENGSYSLHEYSIKEKKSKKITDLPSGSYPINYSNDGNLLIISTFQSDDENQLSVYDFQSNQIKPIIGEDSDSFFGDPFFMGTDKIICISDLNSDFRNIASIDIKTGFFSYVIKEQNDIDQFKISKDQIHWISNKNGFSSHKYAQLNSPEKFKTIAWPQGVIKLAENFSQENPIVQIQNAKMPGDCWRYDLNNKTFERLTYSNTGGVNLTRNNLPVAVEIPTSDNRNTFGLLYLPDSIDSSTPFIIRVHGGPTHQSKAVFHNYTHFLNANGYIVLDLNYRGSTGYGKQYAKANNFENRIDEIHDINAAVDYFKTLEYGNSDRIGIYGASYGGYLSLSAAWKLSKEIDCAVSIAGVSDWVSNLQNASPMLKANDKMEYGDIEDQKVKDFFYELSPVNHTDQIGIPLIIANGVNDSRVLVNDSDIFVEKLKSINPNITYLRFEDEGHMIYKKANQQILQQSIIEFFDTWLM